MNKQYISEAFDTLHKMQSKKKIVKENTSVTTRAVKRNPHKRLVEAYEDFDEFYDAVWQTALDSGVEVVDDAIQGSRGTTWVRFSDDGDVFQIDESKLVDAVETVFNTTKSIEDAIGVMRDVATYSMRYNESDDPEGDWEDEAADDAGDEQEEGSGLTKKESRELSKLGNIEYPSIEQWQRMIDLSIKDWGGVDKFPLRNWEEDLNDNGYILDMSDRKHPKVVKKTD